MILLATFVTCNCKLQFFFFFCRKEVVTFWYLLILNFVTKNEKDAKGSLRKKFKIKMFVAFNFVVHIMIQNLQVLICRIKGTD